MDDKNLHIDPSLNNEYPVPDIPVDQAWESMQLLLDSPVNTVTPAKPEGIAFSWKVGFYSLILFVIISLLSWWLLSEKKLRNENLRVKSVNNIATNNTSKNNTGQQIINDSLNTIRLKINNDTQSIYTLSKTIKTIRNTDGQTASQNGKDSLINSSDRTFYNSDKNVVSNNNSIQPDNKSIVSNAEINNTNKNTNSLKNSYKKIVNSKHKFKNPKQQNDTDANLNAINYNSSEINSSGKTKNHSINFVKKINKTIDKKNNPSSTNLKASVLNKLLPQSNKIIKNKQLNLLSSNTAAKDKILSNKNITFKKLKSEISLVKKNLNKLTAKKKANLLINTEDSVHGTMIESTGDNIFYTPNKITLNKKNINDSKAEDKIAELDLSDWEKNKLQLAKHKIKRKNSILTSGADGKIEGISISSQPIKPIEQSSKQRDIKLPTRNTLLKTVIDPSLIGYRNNVNSINKFGNHISRQSGIPEYQNRLNSANKKSNAKLFKSFNAGFQWNVAIPLQKTSDYFTGRKNLNEPLQLLVPTLWISKKINKNELMVSFNFTQQNFTGNNFVVGYTTEISAVDSSILITNAIVKKTFGFAAGLQYNYRLNKYLDLEFGLKYNSQGGGALFDSQTVKQSNGNVLSDSSYIISRDLLTQYQLRPSFLSAQFGVVYKIKKFGVGLNFLLPLTNLTISPFILKPAAAQLFIRWRIKNN